MMEEQLRTLLAPVARVDWGAQPQGAPLPGVVLNVVSETGHHHMQGANKLRQARVQVDCYADTYLGASLVAANVRAIIDGHRDDNFQGIFLISSRTSREGTYEGEVTRPYRVSADYETWWSETNA